MRANAANMDRGFSLIELIVVIVILSILAVIGAQFVVSTTQMYEQTRTRALMVNTGRQALERMTRQLRGALPYSVRITNSGVCLEFLPIAGGGNYLVPVPDTSNLVPESSTISVSPHGEDFGNARFVSIGALSAAEIYGPGISSSSLATRNASSLTLTSTKRWERNSINRRFYLLDNPQAFCVVGNELRFYPNQSISESNINLDGLSHLLAKNVTASVPFLLAQGIENRNTIVQINLHFVSGPESVDFQQQVMIRNVP